MLYVYKHIIILFYFIKQFFAIMCLQACTVSMCLNTHSTERSNGTAAIHQQGSLTIGWVLSRQSARGYRDWCNQQHPLVWKNGPSSQSTMKGLIREQSLFMAYCHCSLWLGAIVNVLEGHNKRY